jgi:hypothetical protein
MEDYGDINGKSGILAYETGPDFIRVKFKNDSVYLYTYASADPHSIEQMKSLAAAGEGLNTFINQYLRQNLRLGRASVVGLS